MKKELQNKELKKWTRLSWNFSEYQKFLKWLTTFQEDSYREFQQKLIPNIQSILGIRTPILHKISKEISKGTPESFLNEVTYQYYEESILAGFVIGDMDEKRISLEHRLNWLTQFLPKINNWSTCDLTVANLKICRNYPEQFFSWLFPYLKQGKEFELRFAVVMMMNYYLTPEYKDRVFINLSKIQRQEYYVLMAVAWCYASAYFKFPEITKLQLEQKRNLLEKQIEQQTVLSSDFLLFQMTLSKISDSFRCTKQDKEWIHTMKLSMYS